MPNKCLVPEVADLVAVADADLMAHLRMALSAGPMVDLADRLVLPIAHHLHQPTAEESNKRVVDCERLVQSN